MKVKRKIIEIDDQLCDGCGQCISACAEGAIEIIDGTAKVVSDNLCDGLGACIGECPQGALKIIEREADEFDEQAVEKHLTGKESRTSESNTLACGCPSTQIQDFTKKTPCQAADSPTAFDPGNSELNHWPVQIKLIPPNAPFLKQADLLVTADCVPVSYPAFHQDFLKGRAVMMGCPKLDDVEEYIDKFAAVFQTADINSILCVIMEVPCCSGLPAILLKGMEKAGKQVPMEVVVVNARGEILTRKKAA